MVAPRCLFSSVPWPWIDGLRISTYCSEEACLDRCAEPVGVPTLFLPVGTTAADTLQGCCFLRCDEIRPAILSRLALPPTHIHTHAHLHTLV